MVHIYAFGSLCRGDIDQDSDIDLLAIVDGHDDRFDQFTYSVYSYDRILELWTEGNPFAWHLYREAKMIFSSDDRDFFEDLGCPKEYLAGYTDCQRFYEIFQQAKASYLASNTSKVFDLSAMFLGMRNFATCYSLGFTEVPTFSRNSAKELGDKSIAIKAEVYDTLKQARILCTRATGDIISDEKMVEIEPSFSKIEKWMVNILHEIGDCYE